MTYRSAEALVSSPWRLVAEGFLYEHLNVPETWVARREGEVALLVGGRRQFGHSAALDEELRRPANQRAPLVGARSFHAEPVLEPGITSASGATRPTPAPRSPRRSSNCSRASAAPAPRSRDRSSS